MTARTPSESPRPVPRGSSDGVGDRLGEAVGGAVVVHEEKRRLGQLDLEHARAVAPGDEVDARVEQRRRVERERGERSFRDGALGVGRLGGGDRLLDVERVAWRSSIGEQRGLAHGV